MKKDKESKFFPEEKKKIEDGKKLLKFIGASKALRECDNKELCWLFERTSAFNELNILSVDAAIFYEISDRLYPEFDGDEVTSEEWGWKTPEGDIVYDENKYDLRKKK